MKSAISFALRLYYSMTVNSRQHHVDGFSIGAHDFYVFSDESMISLRTSFYMCKQSP